MRQLRLLLGTVLVSALLLACRDDSVVLNGEVSGPGRPARPLSASQIEYLNDWMKEHRSKWGMVLATPPSVPSLSVQVRRASGSSGSILFYEEWPGSLMYRSSDIDENRLGGFGEAAVASLRRELGPPQ